MIFLILGFFIGTANAVNVTSYPESRDFYFSGSSVFSNYVKNPNCFKNTNNITTANSGFVTKNEVKPLKGSGDCRIYLSPNSNAYVEWDSKNLDYWLYNQSCEARLTYVTYSVPSKVSIDVYVGSTSYPSSPISYVFRDATVYSKKFPCGDLQNKPKVRVTANPGNSAGFIGYFTDAYIGAYTSYPSTGKGL